MGLLDSVSGLFGRKPRIADRAALMDFMDAQASFLCQKCVIEFCRVRAGVYWQKLFSEKEFLDALNVSVWKSYPAALAMVAEMVEAALRPSAGLRRRLLPGVLDAAAGEIFARYDEIGADEKQAASAYVQARLQDTQSGPPRAVRDMVTPSARVVFEALPIHRDIVTNDYDYIRNNLRMNLLRAHEDFLARADLPALEEDLLGRK